MHIISIQIRMSFQFTHFFLLAIYYLRILSLELIKPMASDTTDFWSSLQKVIKENIKKSIKANTFITNLFQG